MSLSFLYIIAGIALLNFSCAPITIKYSLTSSNSDTINQLGYLNDSSQVLKCKIEQSHYPNDEVKNYIEILLENSTNDTIIMEVKPWLRLSTKVNVIDSVQINDFFLQNRGNNILPHGKLRISHTYWSNSFKGSFSQLINILKGEELNIIVNYKVNNNVVLIDSVSLKPDLKRFKS